MSIFSLHNIKNVAIQCIDGSIIWQHVRREGVESRETLQSANQSFKGWVGSLQHINPQTTLGKWNKIRPNI